MSELFQGTAQDAGIKPLQRPTATTPAPDGAKSTTPTQATAPAQNPAATPGTTPVPTQPKSLTPAQAEAARMRELQDKTTNAVLEHITALQSEGKLRLPANYSAGNELKMAWLTLLEVEDRDHNKALEVCTKESIANALLKMSLMGLSVAKKQAAFVMYGKKLELQVEYHGTVALARRFGGIKETPKANVVYKDDEFIYTIDPETGRKKIVKHEQKIENIDPNNIVAAYAIVTEEDGSKNTEIMSMQQIRQAWMQGATKGQSTAHKNFPDQMAIKTVIGRACKLYISTSDDGGVYTDEETTPALPEPKAPAKAAQREVIDTDYDDVTPKHQPEATPEPADQPTQRKPSF